MTRSFVRRWACVPFALCLGVMGARARADEPAPPAAPPANVSVLVALPGGILPGEDAEVRRAVDVYLHDFRPEVEEIGPLPGGMRAQIARTVEVARSRDMRLAVVLFWSAQTAARVLTATFVDLRAPDTRPVSFRIDWPHNPDAAFYRLLGLKVRSTLLAILGAPPSSPDGGAGGRRGGGGAADEGRLRFGITAAAAGDLAIESRAAVPSFGGGLRLELGRWGFGVAAMRGLEERRTNATAEAQGDTAMTRVMVEASSRLARVWERLGFFVSLHLGVAQLRTTGRDLATRVSQDHSQWIPLTSFSFTAGYDIGPYVRVVLGPRLDVFLVRGWYSEKGVRVYDTGWVQPGLDLKVMALF